MLAEVDTQKGARAYVPLLSLVNLGIESFSKLQEMKAVEISADLDVASYLYSGGARDRSVVENGGLVVRQDMGDSAGRANDWWAWTRVCEVLMALCFL